MCGGVLLIIVLMVKGTFYAQYKCQNLVPPDTCKLLCFEDVQARTLLTARFTIFLQTKWDMCRRPCMPAWLMLLTEGKDSNIFACFFGHLLSSFVALVGHSHWTALCKFFTKALTLFFMSASLMRGVLPPGELSQIS